MMFCCCSILFVIFKCVSKIKIFIATTSFELLLYNKEPFVCKASGSIEQPFCFNTLYRQLAAIVQLLSPHLTSDTRTRLAVATSRIAYDLL